MAQLVVTTSCVAVCEQECAWQHEGSRRILIIDNAHGYAVSQARRVAAVRWVWKLRPPGPCIVRAPTLTSRHVVVPIIV